MTNPEKFEPKIEPREKPREKPKEEEKEFEKQEALRWEKELEIEEFKKQEIGFLDKELEEIEAKVAEKFYESSKLSDDVKEKIVQLSDQELEEKYADFYKKWYDEDNKKKLKKEKVDITDEAKARLAKERGALEQLKTREKYEEQWIEITNIKAANIDFRKERIPSDSQIIMLNVLNKRAERIEKEMIKAQEQGDTATEIVKAKEREELFKTRKELSEKYSGRNLEEEAEKKVEPLEKEEEYIDKNLSERIDQVKDYLQELGYETEKKGIIRRKTKVIDAEGNNVGEFRTKKELDEFLEKKTEEKIKKELGEEWVEKDSSRTSEMQSLIEKEMQTLGKSPEKAEGGIKTACERIIERLRTEYLDKGFKKEKKTKEQLEKIKKDFEKKGKNIFESKKMTGNWEQDKENISSFLRELGILFKPESLKKYQEDKNKKGKNYEKEIKEKGLLGWLIEFIFGILFELLELEKKKKKEK